VNTGGVTYGGVNTGVPNVARIYDFFLGGADNFGLARKTAP
jgi:hypothetical protein